MSEKEGGAGARRTAEEREVLNADGQSARLVSNTTGEYSLDRAREGFGRAEAETTTEDEGGTEDGGTGDRR